MLPVKCNQHPWMKMYVNVVKTPFYAVTGERQIRTQGPAAGRLHAGVRPGKARNQTQKVTLAAKDSKTVDQGFKP